MSDSTQSGFNFSVSDSQETIKQKALDFALTYLKPHVMEWDEAQIFPVEAFKKLGKSGLLATLIPVEYGGSGLGYLEDANMISEIARVCGAIALSIVAHSSLCSG